MRSNFAKLLKYLRRSFPTAELETVRKAYRVANDAHTGQVRQSGEPYVIHCLKVGQILAKLGLDPVTCAAGVLHDVIEDNPDYSRKRVADLFGEEIAALVDGVTKIGGLSLVGEPVELEVKQAQNIRKMLVATAKDVRVILIKLADRLHNMRTIEFLEQEKAERIARETLDIYAPLAHRLGISRWRWELEDHAFHTLMPEEYREVSQRVAMKRRERERYLNSTISFLEARLNEAEVDAQVIGRPKHLYSIYRKMASQGKNFDEVLDLHGIRIITQTEAGCYNTLGIVHNLWTPVPGRMKDYIAMPKQNLYQAIHTTVMRENGHPMEVQIRSAEMDRTAREGIAAHWVYKEGTAGKDSKLDEQLAWLRQMYEWLKDASAPDELMDSMRRDFKETNIYVFTPKGEVKELPLGATPLDFAYLIHSDIGHQCIGARVNGGMVPFRYHLQMGDVVEVLTSKHQSPKMEWIDIVVTGRARTRIRQRLRELGVLEPLESSEPEEQPSRPASRKQAEKTPAKPVVRAVDEATRKKLIRIEGNKDMAVHFAKCCNPMPGTPVIGYVTKSPGVSVHRADCKSFSKSQRDPARILEASWEGDTAFTTAMRVVIGPRPNVLADLTQMLRPLNLDITKAQYGPGEGGKSFFDFTFEALDQSLVGRVARSLRSVPGVTHVTQLNVHHKKDGHLADAG